MKTTGFLAIFALLLFFPAQQGLAQHEGHDKEEGMACCSKDAMEKGGDHDMKGHDKGMSMAHVLITHDVEDGDHWLAAWSGENSRHDTFKANGVKMVHVMQDPSNPNKVGLIVAVTDMDKFKAFLDSDEGKAAAAEDGVVWDTLTMLLEKK